IRICPSPATCESGEGTNGVPLGMLRHLVKDFLDAQVLIRGSFTLSLDMTDFHTNRPGDGKAIHIHGHTKMAKVSGCITGGSNPQSLSARWKRVIVVEPLSRHEITL